MRHVMRNLFISASLACLLLAPGVSNAAEGGKRFEFAKIGSYFVAGARFYAGAFGDIFSKLRGRIAPTTGGEGATCEEALKCGRGLSCLNVCLDADCGAYAKRCAKGTGATAIVPEYGPCGTANVCAVGTACARTCPTGGACAVMHRCLKPNPAGGACATAADCVAGCARLGFPPIGASGWRASCTEAVCGCALQETDPTAPVAPCEGEIPMACPAGQRASCTPGTSGAPRATCLNAPEFGGQCLGDADCGAVGCSEGAASFCDADRRCRCRSVSIETISCESASDCDAVACESGQIRACVSGACGCAIEEAPTTSCTQASECAECASGLTRACVEGSCSCQRVTENVPVACASVTDCGGVSCPAEYEKTCRDSVCACTRTIVTE